MKALLTSIGTRGDVQPLLALACELKALGHEPLLCVAPNFKEWVESHGIAFVAIGPDLKALTRAMPAVPPTPEQMQALAAQSVRDQFRVLGEAARDCDVLVAANALQIAARSVAERSGCGYVFAAYAPNTFPSSELMPARTIPLPPGEGTPRSAWAVERQSWNARFVTTLNEERAALKLAPVSDIMDHVFGGGVWLACDPVIGPAPETDLEIVQTGAWIMRDDLALPEPLEAFLAEGEPPIYFGFGSMRGVEGSASILLDAVRNLGRRVIFSRGWSNLVPADRSDDCIVIGDVSHAALFQRVAAVVHHGGAGTTHTAALAGCPQLILPHVYDQFYWAQRVQELSMGSRGPEREHLTAEALVSALLNVLRPGTKARAREASKQMEQRGARIAARRLIERVM